jgi:branched-chain amino acid transport system ATP-binding protein
VDVQVREGQVVALIGANGAGKTTLLRTISGLLRSERGRIVFANKAIGGLAPDRRFRAGIVQVPEGRQVFAGLTVAENLRLGAGVQLRGLAQAEVEARMRRVCARFPVLLERLGQPAGNLSGGQQQMLAIARGLMANPKLLLLDEPSLGLSPLFVKNIFDIISEINRQGTSILLVEQNVFQSLRIAHRAYVLETGRVVLTGSGQDLLGNEHVKKAYMGL